MKLSVHLVTWNGAKYIPYLFDSLKKQTFTDWELFVWDNGSEDDTVAFIEREMEHLPVPGHVHISEKNTGFAGGHNALYKKTRGEYFVLLNQDMYLEDDCLEKMVAFMDAHTDTAIASPRLMRWHFAAVERGEIEESFTEYIDTLGLKVFRSRRVIDQYSQERWSSESLHHDVKKLIGTSSVEVFGVSGALPICRRSAIDYILFNDGTFFDETYNSYKEDVDLAFRLRSAGFKAFVVLDAIAYHDRTAAGPREASDRAALANKKEQSLRVRKLSYINHWKTLIKNCYTVNFFLDFPWIAWYEIKKAGYYMLFDTKVFVFALKTAWKEGFAMNAKRAHIVTLRKATWKDIRTWWI